jgi:hypothetical protein
MGLALLLLLTPESRATTADDCIAALGAAWSSIRSYRSGQTVQERVGGTLKDEQRMRVAFRKPWEIQLTWETVYPDRKAYWSAGRNDGDVLVYPGGLLGRTMGTLSFDLHSSLLRRESNHSLDEAGFGYLVQRLVNAFTGKAEARGLRVTGEEAMADESAWVVAIPPLPGFAEGGGEVLVGERTHLPRRFVSRTAEGEIYERFTWFATEVNPSLVDTVDFDLAYR